MKNALITLAILAMLLTVPSRGSAQANPCEPKNGKTTQVDKPASKAPEKPAGLPGTLKDADTEAKRMDLETRYNHWIETIDRNFHAPAPVQAVPAAVGCLTVPGSTASQTGETTLVP